MFRLHGHQQLQGFSVNDKLLCEGLLLGMFITMSESESALVSGLRAFEDTAAT